MEVQISSGRMQPARKSHLGCRDVKNMKYQISPATEMRVVGNGLTGVPEWNPGASPV
jgi:hypothetical protein